MPKTDVTSRPKHSLAGKNRQKARKTSQAHPMTLQPVTMKAK